MDFEWNKSKDLGNKPTVINIHNETLCNENFRTAIWTGKHLQATLMSIPCGGEIGLEIHENLDQLLKIESGQANVYMGKNKNCITFMGTVNQNYAILIPAGTWHNVINACQQPLKMFSVYAPPQHPFGTVHKTKFDSDLAED